MDAISIPIPFVIAAVSIGLTAIVQMLGVLALWVRQTTQLHDLKVRAHAVRLRLKEESALIEIKEERQRAGSRSGAGPAVSRAA